MSQDLSSYFAKRESLPADISDDSATPHLVQAPHPHHTHLGSVMLPDLGVLNNLLRDEQVNDIMINGTHGIFVDRKGELVDTGLRIESDEEVARIAQTIMQSVNQVWDPERPIIDTRLPDGSRVNIVGLPMAVDGISISIRKFPSMRITLDSMVERQQLTPEIAKFLSLCVAHRLNLIIAGGTSSGKTTLLNALSAAISPKERIVTIEDSAELRLQQPHVVRLESKQPINLNRPETAVNTRDLVKNALRMRPDRIIVGESRGPEAFDVIQAMNTGHDGSMTTLHANTPRDSMSRLETMVSMAMPQIATRIVRQQIASTLNLVLQMNRGRDGTRRVTHITEVVGMEGEVLVMQDLVIWNEAHGNKPAEYRWVSSAPRNQLIIEAARQAGLMRGIR